MSSSALPRTPSPAPRQEADVNADGTSKIATGSAVTDSEVLSSDVDQHFFENHLRAYPEDVLSKVRNNQKISRLVGKITAVTTNELAMYHPIASLLSNLSERIFNSLKKTVAGREQLQRHGMRQIAFIDHHSCPLVHFPVGKPDIKPDLLGVYKIGGTMNYPIHKDGSHRDVPYHRVETVIEVKTLGEQLLARRQAGSYIYHMLQTRPDRPSYYGLSATPKYFQIPYGSPLGLVVSEPTPWTDLAKLCAYVHSLYHPPADHIRRDPTISWEEPPGQLFGRPSWTIRAQKVPSDAQPETEEREDVYRGAVPVFLGYPFGRRTTIFRIRRDGRAPVIVKEYYRDDGRRFDEAELLSRIHSDGFVPGVVRTLSSELVEADGETITFGDTASDAGTRSKRRLIMADAGVDLEYAESVNDLLKAAYDILEVHRTVASQRRVLHRDMSLFNILMYPTQAPCKGAKWLQSFPPLIDEILAGERIAPDKCKPRGLLIDFDHSAMLDDVDNKVGVSKELRHRTGTPIYIARAVAASQEPVGRGVLDYHKMPTLEDKAKDLYVKLHGQARYDRYTDDPKGDTFHGGLRPESLSPIEMSRIAQNIPFYHRWRYDAESVFWTLFSVLLRVRPQGSVENRESQKALHRKWTTLKSHSIPEGDALAAHSDTRVTLIDGDPFAFFMAFPSEMQDAAILLFHMSEQIFPSYAYMRKPPPYDDHLHEALQRLILNYLVQHENNPIPLTLGSLRPAAEAIPKDGREVGNYSDMPDSGVKTKGTKRTREESEGPTRQSARKAGGSSLSFPRDDDPPVFRDE